jgi:osmotically-inducible protein OsmY
VFKETVALLMLISAPGVVAAQSGRHDIQIGHSVAAVVSRAPLTVFDDVQTSVYDGVVTVTGTVTDPRKRDEITQRVALVENVRGVTDRIMVLPPSRADDELRQRIARAIYGSASFWFYAMMPSPPIRILVEGRQVTLTGMVRTDQDRMLAGALALQSGALSVSNNLKAAPE